MVDTILIDTLFVLQWVHSVASWSLWLVELLVVVKKTGSVTKVSK